MSREAMQQALDALESIVKEMRVTPAVQGREYVGLGIQANNAIAALRAALAGQPAAPVLTDEQTIKMAAAAGMSMPIELMVNDYWTADTKDILRFAELVRAAAIPPGHVVAPVEATHEMCEAAHSGPNCAEHNMQASDRAYWEDCYRAMIAARPGGRG